MGSDERLPRIGISLGDPAGIGPEVTLKALRDPEIRDLARFVVFGCPFVDWVSCGGAVPSFVTGCTPEDQWDGTTDGVHVVALRDLGIIDIPVGRPTAAGGQCAVRFIRGAIDAARADRLDAIVTAPISKEAVRMAGYEWPGHTEMLAEAFEADEVAMMFAGGPLRVVLATIHLSMADVLRTLSAEQILAVMRLANAALKDRFGIELPRFGVCGLNPHAGEAGLFGHEEREIIEPAIEEAMAEDICAFGPLPADTAFHQAMEGRYDCMVAMYHDQGLIPVKTVAFDRSVNITLGLPTVRTSPDHGTAYDIAGEGRASPDGMKAAIRMAAEMAG